MPTDTENPFCRWLVEGISFRRAKGDIVGQSACGGLTYF
jgi:hypothetical protein